MIVVRVELHKWPAGEVTELARMHICNRGGSRSARTANYSVETFRGRSTAELDRLISVRTGTVRNHPRQAEHVWSLVGKALIAADYIRPRCHPVRACGWAGICKTYPATPVSSARSSCLRT